MASLRDIELRIKSIEGTQQITKAMKLVSTAKLQKAKKRVEQTRPYFEKTKEIISSIVGSSEGQGFLMFDNRKIKKTAIIVITSDRGLAGGYNINLCKMVEGNIKDKSKTTIMTVGKKGRDYFKHKGYEIGKQYEGFSENPNFSQAHNMGRDILEAYTNNEIDEIYLAYTTFKSTITQVPTMLKLLPLAIDEFKNDESNKEKSLDIMNYEPDADEVLKYIIPKYVNSVIYGALVESSASEQGARMTAMDSATDNAGEMIDKLTLKKNRARQDLITQELTEIVSGAQALE